LRSWSLRVWVHLLGAVALAAYVLLAVLSYVQAPTLWQADRAPRAQAVFDAWTAMTGLPPVTRLAGGSAAVIVTSFVPLAVAGLAAAGLLLLLVRHRRPPDTALPRMLLGWAVAFGAACVPALPVFTQDFWLSAAWGRMIAAGSNPYHATFTASSLTGLPLDHFPMAMSYGPLWGLVSGGVMALSGGSVLAAAVLFKLVLAAAWVTALVLVDRIMAARPVRVRCLAIVLMGWMPLSATQTIAEGHNDIAMAVLVVLWLYLMLRDNRYGAPFALIASVLCKYTTMPLLLLDAIYVFGRTRMPATAYLARLALPAAAGLAVFLLFYRSPRFFDGIVLISAWRFLQPRDAVAALEGMLGFPLLPLGIAVVAVFPVVALYWLVAAARSFSAEHVLRAALAVMATVLFAVTPHLWPWYVIWVLPLAALVPQWGLSRFVAGVALLAPFSVAFWWIEDLEAYRDLAALVLYAGALSWIALTYRPSGGRDDVPRLARGGAVRAHDGIEP
jgi:alpha-1,6-mannosyltransferase